MKANIPDVIAELVLQSTPELEERLESQAEALRAAPCTNPVLGRWVDAHDVKYLLSTLALGDEDFAVRFPSMAHLAEWERRQVIAALETHFEHCQHCSLKRGYDLELDARIKQACLQNSELLLELLGEEEELLEEEPVAELTTPRAITANGKI